MRAITSALHAAEELLLLLPPLLLLLCTLIHPLSSPTPGRFTTGCRWDTHYKQRSMLHVNNHSMHTDLAASE
jgi:hypothetical protein